MSANRPKAPATDAAPGTPKFRVPVRDLPTHRKIEVGSEYVGKVLAGMPMRDALGEGADAGHGTLDVELYSEGENVHASGTMRGEVVVACSRCVSAARIPLDERINLTFMPQHALAGLDEEDPSEAAHGHGHDIQPAAEGETVTDDGVELAGEDLDVFPYDGEQVDLEPVVREQLVLAVPYAPLCREDCKGLCPQCGIDRNAETCACEKPLDPRFAALKGLKLPS